MWLFSWLSDMVVGFLSSLGLLNKEASIILIGLDNAGKTTLLHRLAKGSFGSFPPTEKPSGDQFQAGGVKFKAWDLGGHDAVRHLWADFLPTTNGVVFMVDSADADRLPECEEELAALAEDTALYGVPIAVLMNKSDISFALSDDDLRTGLNWDAIASREGPVRAFRTSVLRGTGYTEAFQWLAQHI